jgi:ribosomal protein L11 methylase PrmA
MSNLLRETKLLLLLPPPLLAAHQGMLAIGAALLGSPYVIGLDVDPDALEVAQDNCEQFEDPLPVSNIQTAASMMSAVVCVWSPMDHWCWVTECASIVHRVVARFKARRVQQQSQVAVVIHLMHLLTSMLCRTRELAAP